MEEITFKNFYTAYLSVRLLRRSPGQDAAAKWSTALRDLPLMDNPHTEGGSQDYYSIHRTQVGGASISRGAFSHDRKSSPFLLLRPVGPHRCVRSCNVYCPSG